MVLIAGTMAAGILGSTAHAAWMAPSGGWDVSYDASSGNRPDLASPAWTIGGYQFVNSGSAGYMTVQNDSITNEKTLFMDQNNGYIELSNSGGDGTKDDLITLDFRFRLLDGAQADDQDQLTMNVTRPRPDLVTGRVLYFVNFAENEVFYYDGNTPTASYKPASIGTSWHDVRMLIDVPNNAAELYLDGASTPLFSFSGWASTYPTNSVLFGDNSGGVQGQAELSYLHLANSELAAVPEPATIGLLAAGGSMLLLKRRRTAK